MRAFSNQRIRVGQVCLQAILVGLCWVAPPTRAQTIQRVVLRPDAHRMEQLAAREARRYAYLRTGTLAQIQPSQSSPGPGTVVVTVKGDALIADATLQAAAAALKPQEYLLRTVVGPGPADRVWWIIGGDAQGALYGAYRFAEKLGVRFYLYGDVVPEPPLGAVPEANETGRPVFETRGLVPYHLLPEGPDWWSRDDYLAYLAQVAKLRLNFWGLHTYTFPGVEEPQVWIGLPQDFDSLGQVQFSYPSSWANTQRPHWIAGYGPTLTTSFANGAAALFPASIFAPEVMTGLVPRPATAEGSNLLFNRVAEMFRDVFATARGLGIQTSLGTEAPFILSPEIQTRLQILGKSSTNNAVRREFYRGIFARIQAAHPVEHYWLWTPEQWTWTGNTLAEYGEVTNDLQIAQGALTDLGNPMKLATAGWVLGPQHDRAALDHFLPKHVPMSALNRNGSAAPIDLGFEGITNRPKWAIPWLEVDAYISAPQLWAGRTLYDAADAQWLGCSGLLGIHWRTKATAPNQAALSAATWDLSYVPPSFHAARPPLPDGAIGGDTATFTMPVANTVEDPIYQSVRYDLSAYRLALSNGAYSLTLKFNEPYYVQPGKRVFGVRIQGQQVIEHLDIFARVGGNYALDLVYSNIAVTSGELRIDFTQEVELPCIAGIAITGQTTNGTPVMRRINCGGGAVLGYEEDRVGIAGRDAHRSITPLSLYADFAAASFGTSLAGPVAEILDRMDGRLFMPVTWDHGAGAIVIQQTPWSVLRTNFNFVDELTALRPQVQGAGNLARFDYWLNSFRYLSDLAEVGCVRGQFDLQMQQISATTNPQTKINLAQAALTNRISMARIWDRMMWRVLSIVSTPGELGTVANLHQQNLTRRQFLTTNDNSLAEVLGAPLPASVNLATHYSGPPRLIVPTARTLVAIGENLTVKAIVLNSNAPVQAPVLHWRWLGTTNFQSIAMTNFGGANYQSALPGGSNDLEYWLTAQLAGTNQVNWPPDNVPHTVVVWSPPVRPSPPTNLTTTAGAEGVTLTWDAVPSATGYVVKRSTSNALFFPTIATTAGVGFTDSTATNAAPFYYVVSATNADYESINSRVVTAIPPVEMIASPAGAPSANVLLRWPGWASGLRPYHATNLVPPVHWEALTNLPFLSNGQFHLVLPATNEPQQFFRLGHP